MESMGVVVRRYVYRFPHVTIPTPLVSVFFVAASLDLFI